ncbi:MAG: hypothetical protein QG650_411 [Patescibacteria group bacterium]|nr:hypothetical protein [Patescibacteria group bacterium]
MERQKNLADLKTDVGQEIQKEYMETLSLISDENVSVDNNVGQLLEMHVILSKTLKTIDPFKKTSSDTCKVQAANVPANCNGE